MEDFMIYKDDKIQIQFVNIGGKKELAIDYFMAGVPIGRMVTSDLYNINLIDFNGKLDISLAE
jgi:hypothetical protein